MRRYVALVVSSKGGVGKSTVAMQIVTPYLFIKNDFAQVAFYECDDENCDSYSYGASTLSKRAIIKVSDPYLYRNICAIFEEPNAVCIDVGGNKTTQIVLDALEQSGMIHFVDVVFIPMLDGEQDAINASLVYNRIRLMNESVPIFFVLNRVRARESLQMQFENFFGDVHEIFEVPYAVCNYLQPYERENYICIQESELFKHSRRFGLTIYEIASMRKDFLGELKRKGDRLSSKEMRLLSFKSYLERECKSFYRDHIAPLYRRLDEKLQRE